VGLNHLTWERGVRVDGENQLPKLLASRLAGDATAMEEDA
jgi:alpha-galactosidase/6-phospho-beta-glucosidase family protein